MLILNLISSPITFFFFAIAVLASLTVHEFSHAFVAYKFGDLTAKNMGRLTLNPIAHVDLWGTIFLLIAGFGWGKPVMVNSSNFENPATDDFIVSLAGPLSNLGLAICFGLIYRFVPVSGLVETLLFMMVFYNLVFMIFNLLPIPPLDGSAVYGLFLPQEVIMQMQQIGILILFALVAFSSLIPVIPFIINHVVGFFFTLITGQPITL